MSPLSSQSHSPDPCSSSLLLSPPFCLLPTPHPNLLPHQPQRVPSHKSAPWALAPSSPSHHPGVQIPPPSLPAPHSWGLGFSSPLDFFLVSSSRKSFDTHLPEAPSRSPPHPLCRALSQLRSQVVTLNAYLPDSLATPCGQEAHWLHLFLQRPPCFRCLVPAC